MIFNIYTEDIISGNRLMLRRSIRAVDMSAALIKADTIITNYNGIIAVCEKKKEKTFKFKK